MRYAVLSFLSMAAPVAAFADAGHGETSPASFAHLLELDHLVPMVASIIVGATAVTLYTRKYKKRVENVKNND